jgi:DNA-binding CsgD family transcriptional regulator/PAS domain-containing protein
MESPLESAFLDRVYAAVVDPSQWAGALEGFADLVHGSSVFLSRLSLVDGRGPTLTARIDPYWQRAYNEHYSAMNPYARAADPQAFLRGWTPKIVTGEDWLDEDALQESAYYHEFMRPQDVRSVMFARLAARDLRICAITVNRPKSQGAFTPDHLATARRVHPHLVRAFRLAEDLAAMGGLHAGLETVLEHSPYALALLGNDGNVVRMNRAAERLVADQRAVRVINGRVVASQFSDDRALQALIAAATSRTPPRSGAMSLRSPDHALPLKAQVSPISAEPASIFEAPRGALLSISDPNLASAQSAEAMRLRFQFTPAEARVALQAAEGRSAREIAADLKLSVNTVRRHLQMLLEKTGASRQADLVRLLMSGAAPEPGELF